MTVFSRKLLLVLTFAAASSLMTGCAQLAYTEAPVAVPMGGLYQQTKAPLTYKTPFKVSEKVGRAYASYIAVPFYPTFSASVGDASIQTAAKSAGITKIHHIDYARTNILSVFTRIEVFVYGE